MKTGILFLNLGGPETLDEVRPFLFRLFRDPDIIPLPKWLRWLSWPIAWLIAKFRTPGSQEAYASIGGGSPLRRTNQAVADKLLPRLKAAGLADEIAIAMRYWHPLTEIALDQLEKAGVERILCVPMYPQYSTTTTMSSYRVLNKQLKKRAKRWQPEVIRLLDYHLDPDYLKCVEARTLPLIEKIKDTPQTSMVLVSAHSIPLDRVLESGDPYPKQVEAMAEAIRRFVPENLPTEIAYQSRVGPVQWVGPEVSDKLHELHDRGYKNLVVIPVSFVSEHVETLEELDQEYAEVADELGFEQFLRVPTVKADDDFIEFLERLVRESLANPPQLTCRRAEAGLPCICEVA